MLSNRPAALAGGAVLAGALAVTGCTASAASTSAASTGATAAAATPGDNAHLMVYSINSDGPDFRAIVTGASATTGPP